MRQNPSVKAQEGIRTLPRNPFHAPNKIEVLVAAQRRQGRLSGKGCDPEVIARNRPPAAPQLIADVGVMPSRPFVHAKHSAAWDQFIQPSFVPGSAARLHDPESVLAKDNHGNGELGRFVQQWFQSGIAVRKGRQSVRIEYHCLTASPQARSVRTRFDDLANARRFVAQPAQLTECPEPGPVRHAGVSQLFGEGIGYQFPQRNPLFGSRGLARLKRGSGISSVVFIYFPPIFTGVVESQVPLVPWR